MNKFWNFATSEDGERTLHFDGIIAKESWWGDEITPAQFRAELFAGEGDVTVWINSPGGDCVAASEIYTMLMEYKGNVTVKIGGIAASAASVIAMAGTKVMMAPTALIYIHNPWSMCVGDSEEMRKAAAMLDNVKEAIINAYELKTGLSRVKLSNLMNAESSLPVQLAIALGFADGMLLDDKKTYPSPAPDVEDCISTQKAANTALMNKMLASIRNQYPPVQPGTPVPPKSSASPQEPPASPKPEGIAVESLEKRLFLISH